MVSGLSRTDIYLAPADANAGAVSVSEMSLPQLMAQSISGDQNTGIIEQNPKHWSVEPFIPLELGTIIDVLCRRGELTPDQQADFRGVCEQIQTILHRTAASNHTQFERLYLPFDPDCDSYRPSANSDSNEAVSIGDTDTASDRPAEGGVSAAMQTDTKPAGDGDAVAVVDFCRHVLSEAGYRQLGDAEIEKCVGVASQWGVPLRVDFELFDQLIVYTRGDVVGSRVCRRLRRLYRPEMLEVPIYQRLVVLFRLRDDLDSGEELLASGMHLRMFKNIPKQDVDMLLPGGRVKLSGVDGLKILLPTLGGMAMSFQRFAKYALAFAIVAFKSTALMIGLGIAALVYLVRSGFSYFQTKQRYLLNLTRNLYFQKLDTNVGVGYRIVQQAHRQICVEAVLAYYALLSPEKRRPETEPAGSFSARRLRRRCERLVREEIEVEIEFNVDRAIRYLETLGLATSADEDGKISVIRRGS